VSGRDFGRSIGQTVAGVRRGRSPLVSSAAGPVKKKSPPGSQIFAFGTKGTEGRALGGAVCLKHRTSPPGRQILLRFCSASAQIQVRFYSGSTHTQCIPQWIPQRIPQRLPQSVRKAPATRPQSVHRASAKRPQNVREASTKPPRSVRKASAERPHGVHGASAKRPQSGRKASTKRPQSVRKASTKRPQSVRKASAKHPQRADSRWSVAD
jgi:hypothetical protein